MRHLNSFRLLLLTLVIVSVVMMGCQPASSEEPVVEVEGAEFGSAINTADVVTADEALASASELEGSIVTVEGTIREVCRNAGCWFIFETSADQVLRIHVPRDEAGDYVFTLPKDIFGKDAVVEGRLFEKELSESEQAHYSEEGEAAAPAREYRIEANGVVVRGLEA